MEISFGNFLKQKRKEKNLTQKNLAQLLYVSESAVSKWEKDVAHPDITLLPKLSEILDVSEHELITASIDKQARNEKIEAKKWRVFSMSWDLFFYISYGIAILSCFICNLAINKTLSWFWIVLSSLILSFTFTNLPKLIKRYKLILIPLSMYFSLCIVLGVCAIYTHGNWFWITSLSILFSLIVIFFPIIVSKYKIFAKIRKYNDFISIFIDFTTLNILLLIIDNYTVRNSCVSESWYLKIALPITLIVYLMLNILFSVRFLRINKLLKTGIILFLADIFIYVPPLFLVVSNQSIQREIDSLNVFKANFNDWQLSMIERNVNCIIFLTIMVISILFLISGVILYLRKKNLKNDLK